MIDGLVLIAGGIAAGLFGSLLGLGGGLLIVPLLTLGFGLPLRTAVGVSLVCVIVTSSASAGVYLERHVANLRLGMVLELFTAIGALGGRARRVHPPGKHPRAAVRGAPRLRRGDDGPAPRCQCPFRRAARWRRTPLPPRIARRRLPSQGRATGSVTSGSASSGASSQASPRRCSASAAGLVKVPVMHVLMGVPLRVATATSNLMIGITASASAIIYLLRGGIDPYVAAPTAIGVFLGASLGSRIADRIHVRVLRGLFVAILLYTSWQMLLRALA